MYRNVNSWWIWLRDLWELFVVVFQSFFMFEIISKEKEKINRSGGGFISNMEKN